MKVFITGATGFIGKHLVKSLVNEGYEVSVLVRKTSNLNSLKYLDINFFYGGLSDKEELIKAAKDTHYVIHLAGVIHPVNVSEKFYWNVNVKGTENVIQAALKSKNLKKFIYCSSVTCYGHVENDRETVVNEDYPCHSQNIYGKTKYEGEKLIEKYAKEKGLKYIIIRPARVYGPGDLTLIPVFKLVKKRLFSNIGFDKRYMMPVYIDDLVDSFKLALEKPITNRTYIIAGSDFMDKRAFIRMIAKALDVKPRNLSVPATPVKMLAFFCEQVFKIFNKEPFLSRKKLKFFLMSRKYSIERAKKELNFFPKVDLEEGMKRTLNWYKEKNLI